MCEGKLFLRQKNVGLMEIVNDSLKLIPGGEMFITKNIFMMAAYDSKRVLIGTDTEGLYLYNGTKIIPFPTGLENYLKKIQDKLIKTPISIKETNNYPYY